MKNSVSIRKLLFINKESIALIVFNMVNGSKNILFSKQRSLKNALLKTQISELITDASNFLEFLIKDVEVIFEDTNFVKVSNVDHQYIDCYNKEDVINDIYKNAKIQNHYVNEINFESFSYDDATKTSTVSCEYVASEYKDCTAYVLAVRECNVEVTNLTNIYTLINNKKASNQIIIDMSKETTVVSEYVLGKLVNLTNFDLQMNSIYAKLADKYNVTKEQVKKMLAICNNIEASDKSQVLLNLNFDLKFKKFYGVKASKFIKAYQDEIKANIASNFNLYNYGDVCVFTNKSVNMIDNARIISTSFVTGLETIDADRVVAFKRMQTNNQYDSQYQSETTINFRVRSLAA